ncbi:hypothetical protein JOE44_001906 [Chryseobacterium sp. PvR013]|uniref:hypothetical protein n=1 Tax=Chryseobacterium sp. PvR013 TaxID=2806595 RepID=UPI001AE7A3A1|nr:hypothetical protein [Chryseobacterium sp. PvR013]MBP1165022.1 hypothetical protein [Chryseobacterium sp. PvR013]
MNLKELIEGNPILNQAQIAKAMFPNDKYAPQTLSAKLREVKQKTGAQRITEEDTKNAVEVLDKLVKNIEAYKKDNPTK